MGEPALVSVVVPVRNRRDLLADLLVALEKQTHPAFEVIIIDDHSNDDPSVETAGRIIGGNPVRLLPARGRGAVAARTQGVEASSGTILAFTDSDCVPSAGWIAAGVEAIEGGADLANGPTRPTRPPLPGERTMWSGREGLYPTCNLFFRRSAFDRAGGFDGSAVDRLGFRMDQRAKGLGFGEDTLLAWRVRRAGTAAYAPEAIVEHHVFPPDTVESLRRSWMAAAFPALIKEVPELRDTLVLHRVQLGHRTRLPLYVTAALLAIRGPAAATIGLAWWTSLRMNELRRAPVGWRRRIQTLPAEMAQDVVTAGALLVGSVRAKTLLV